MDIDRIDIKGVVMEDHIFDNYGPKIKRPAKLTCCGRCFGVDTCVYDEPLCEVCFGIGCADCGGYGVTP